MGDNNRKGKRKHPDWLEDLGVFTPAGEGSSRGVFQSEDNSASIRRNPNAPSPDVLLPGSGRSLQPIDPQHSPPTNPTAGQNVRIPLLNEREASRIASSLITRPEDVGHFGRYEPAPFDSSGLDAVLNTNADVAPIPGFPLQRPRPQPNPNQAVPSERIPFPPPPAHRRPQFPNYARNPSPYIPFALDKSLYVPFGSRNQAPPPSGQQPNPIPPLDARNNRVPKNAPNPGPYIPFGADKSYVPFGPRNQAPPPSGQQPNPVPPLDDRNNPRIRAFERELVAALCRDNPHIRNPLESPEVRALEQSLAGTLLRHGAAPVATIPGLEPAQALLNPNMPRDNVNTDLACYTGAIPPDPRPPWPAGFERAPPPPGFRPPVGAPREIVFLRRIPGGKGRVPGQGPSGPEFGRGRGPGPSLGLGQVPALGRGQQKGTGNFPAPGQGRGTAEMFPGPVPPLGRGQAPAMGRGQQQRAGDFSAPGQARGMAEMFPAPGPQQDVGFGPGHPGPSLTPAQFTAMTRAARQARESVEGQVGASRFAEAARQREIAEQERQTIAAEHHRRVGAAQAARQEALAEKEAARIERIRLNAERRALRAEQKAQEKLRVANLRQQERIQIARARNEWQAEQAEQVDAPAPERRPGRGPQPQARQIAAVGDPLNNARAAIVEQEEAREAAEAVDAEAVPALIPHSRLYQDFLRAKVDTFAMMWRNIQGREAGQERREQELVVDRQLDNIIRTYENAMWGRKTHLKWVANDRQSRVRCSDADYGCCWTTKYGNLFDPDQEENRDGEILARFQLEITSLISMNTMFFDAGAKAYPQYCLNILKAWMVENDFPTMTKEIYEELQSQTGLQAFELRKFFEAFEDEFAKHSTAERRQGRIVEKAEFLNGPLFVKKHPLTVVGDEVKERLIAKLEEDPQIPMPWYSALRRETNVTIVQLKRFANRYIRLCEDTVFAGNLWVQAQKAARLREAALIGVPDLPPDSDNYVDRDYYGGKQRARPAGRAERAQARRGARAGDDEDPGSDPEDA